MRVDYSPRARQTNRPVARASHDVARAGEYKFLGCKTWDLIRPLRFAQGPDRHRGRSTTPRKNGCQGLNCESGPRPSAPRKLHLPQRIPARHGEDGYRPGRPLLLQAQEGPRGRTDAVSGGLRLVGGVAQGKVVPWRSRSMAWQTGSFRRETYASALTSVTSNPTGVSPSLRQECMVPRSTTRSPARSLTSSRSTRKTISPVRTRT